MSCRLGCSTVRQRASKRFEIGCMVCKNLVMGGGEERDGVYVWELDRRIWFIRWIVLFAFLKGMDLYRWGSFHSLYRLSSTMVTRCLSNLQFMRMYLLKGTWHHPNISQRCHPYFRSSALRSYRWVLFSGVALTHTHTSSRGGNRCPGNISRFPPLHIGELASRQAEAYDLVYCTCKPHAFGPSLTWRSSSAVQYGCNPTGMTATLDRRVQVLKLAREFDLIILEGERGFISIRVVEWRDELLRWPVFLSLLRHWTSYCFLFLAWDDGVTGNGKGGAVW